MNVTNDPLCVSEFCIGRCATVVPDMARLYVSPVCCRVWCIERVASMSSCLTETWFLCMIQFFVNGENKYYPMSIVRLADEIFVFAAALESEDVT